MNPSFSFFRIFHYLFLLFFFNVTFYYLLLLPYNTSVCDISNYLSYDVHCKNMVEPARGKEMNLIFKLLKWDFCWSIIKFCLLQSWSDAIKKAKSIFASLKSTAGQQPLQTIALPISRQHSGYNDEDASMGDNIEENKAINYNLGLWASRSPRGSSRGSRISSLVHSHRYA